MGVIALDRIRDANFPERRRRAAIFVGTMNFDNSVRVRVRLGSYLKTPSIDTNYSVIPRGF